MEERIYYCCFCDAPMRIDIEPDIYYCSDCDSLFKLRYLGKKEEMIC